MSWLPDITPPWWVAPACLLILILAAVQAWDILTWLAWHIHLKVLH
jgi:hypothetical protein